MAAAQPSQFPQPGAGAAPPKAPYTGSPRQLMAYLVAGALLSVVGRILVSWISFGFTWERTDPGDFLRALYDSNEQVPPALLTAYQWGYAGALVAVGALTLANRRAGRGGALLLAWVAVLISVRELVGLVVDDNGFRDRYFHGNGLAVPVVASWIFVLLAAVAVLIVLLRASERPAPGARKGVRGPGSGRYFVSGALLLVLGAVALGWFFYNLVEADSARGELLRDVVDASALRYPSFAGDYQSFGVAFLVAYLVLGVLALMRRPVVRGAAFTLLGIEFYLVARTMLGLTLADTSNLRNGSIGEDGQLVLSWDYYFDTTQGTLSALTNIGTAVIALVVCALLFRAPEAGGTREPADAVPGFASPPLPPSPPSPSSPPFPSASPPPPAGPPGT